jgi:hypothetical protein
MGICTFHFLDSSASGAEQAAVAYQGMKDIGGTAGMAHQCDVEDPDAGDPGPATFAIWRDYVNAIQDKLGRPVVNYTGDWWWGPRGWTGANLTPYLWAAPNAGYPGSYPGDDSPHWHAGWGGWGDYAILQYAVSPIAGAGGGNLSKSAVRDPRVWAALTGGGDVDSKEQIGNSLTFGWSMLTGAEAFVYPNERPGSARINVGNPLWDLLRAIALAANVDAAELAAIEAAARRGAEAALASHADALAAAVVAALPDGELTRADVEAAVRSAVGSLHA